MTIPPTSNSSQKITSPEYREAKSKIYSDILSRVSKQLFDFTWLFPLPEGLSLGLIDKLGHYFEKRGYQVSLITKEETTIPDENSPSKTISIMYKFRLGIKNPLSDEELTKFKPSETYKQKPTAHDHQKAIFNKKETHYKNTFDQIVYCTQMAPFTMKRNLIDFTETMITKLQQELKEQGISCQKCSIFIDGSEYQFTNERMTNPDQKEKK